MTGDGRSPAELADAAYEAVRALNHATMPWEQLTGDADELYQVVGRLAALLHITPQALRQAATWAARAQRDGRVGVDAASPACPDATLASLRCALDRAALLASRAAGQVDAAHQAASHLIIDPPGM